MSGHTCASGSVRGQSTVTKGSGARILTVLVLTSGLPAGHVAAAALDISCPAPGFGEVVAAPAPPLLPFVPLTSLRGVPNPVFPPNEVTGVPTFRADLGEYVANVAAATRLGKALFWEMRAGSDDKTACATCHFKAGADGRHQNQLHPGANAQWDGYGANASLAGVDFPFTDFAAARDIDNVAGSQGVRKSSYQGLGKNGAELTTAVTDPVFRVSGKNVRQVTGIHSPSAINAVFNHRNFWNGRAQPDFNGVNPWGNRDTSARVWVLDVRGTPARVVINIADASPASQAVGPVLNDVEMSAAGRTFPELGRKLLLQKPLGLQKVDATDSVLGPIAATTTGLNTTYTDLIKQAFQPKWWQTTKRVTVNGKTYSMMEANFSLFWGLAIWLYEATLVSDDSPMDRYVASRVFDPFTLDPQTGLPTLVSDNPALVDSVVQRLADEGIAITRQDILDGLALFERPLPPVGTAGLPAGTGVGCNLCHVGAETTSASGRILQGHGPEPGDVAFANLGFDPRMERMFMGMRGFPPVPPGVIPPVPPGTDAIDYDTATYAVKVTSINGSAPATPLPAPAAVYDGGWYNVGLRPTADNIGLGGQDPFGKALSWTRLFQALPDPSFIKVPGGGLGCATSPPAAPATSPFAGEVLNPLTNFPLLSGPLRSTEAAAVTGTFKTSSLRNLELSGPYFHNGGAATLRQLVDFYDRGGNFETETLSPLVRPLGLTAQQRTSLVAFLVALTDERVRWQRAPFDHPQLFVPNGDSPAGTDSLIEIRAVGAQGATEPLERFLNLNPFAP